MSHIPYFDGSQLMGFLEKHGYAEDRQSGSHLTLWNEDRRLSVTIPIHGAGRLGRGLAVRILKDAGFTVEDFING